MAHSDQALQNPLISHEDLEKSDGHNYLSWHDITYTIPAATGKTSSSNPGKVILNHISGHAGSRCVTAILGPSGSGKTSLLNTLASRVPPTKGAVLTGELRVNNSPICVEEFSQYIGYVEQEDALFAFSSVMETIAFSAHLRLPRSMSAEEKQARCDAVISELGLVATQDTIVGGISNGRAIRGVSGGERKRVAIAIELLYNPGILFLDEPTSGLDSFQALNVMRHLGHCASTSNRLVVCSIHQPRSAIYHQLDKVIILSQGNVCYQGATEECASFFAQCGYSVPTGFNPADWFLDTISIDFRSDELLQKSQDTVDTVVASYLAQAQGQPTVPQGTAHLSLHQFSGSSSFLTQVRMLTIRSWRERVRDKTTLTIKAIFNILFSVLFGLVYLRMDTDETSLQNRTGILFFQAMNMAFGAAIGTAQVIPLQIRVVSRERVSNLYSVLPFYIATFMTQVPLELTPQLLAGAVVYFLTNLRPGLDHFLIFSAVLGLENLAAIALGMTLSSLFKDVSMVPQLAPAFVIVFVMFSGYLLNDDSVPKYLAPLKYISFVRYAFQALCVNEFKTSEDSSDAIAHLCDRAHDPSCNFESGNAWLDGYLHFGSVRIVDCMLYLVGVLAGFHLLAYFLLCVGKPKFLEMKRTESV